MRFAQKTAFITGATRGIGHCIAEAFARQGANTILVGRDFDRVRSTQEFFQTNFVNQSHQGVVLNISNRSEIDEVLKVKKKIIAGISLLVFTTHYRIR
jgi:3-oxoacyl-[acyl-carrier protein] reductase